MRTVTNARRAEARQVIAAGPEPGMDKTGADTLIWQVWAADADRNPVSRVYKCYGYWRTRILAASMADDRGVPLVDETKEAGTQPAGREKRRAYLLGLIGKKEPHGKETQTDRAGAETRKGGHRPTGRAGAVPHVRSAYAPHPGREVRPVPRLHPLPRPQGDALCRRGRGHKRNRQQRPEEEPAYPEGA